MPSMHIKPWGGARRLESSISDRAPAGSGALPLVDERLDLADEALE
jgi:hypothetical protein